MKSKKFTSKNWYIWLSLLSLLGIWAAIWMDFAYLFILHNSRTRKDTNHAFPFRLFAVFCGLTFLFTYSLSFAVVGVFSLISSAFPPLSDTRWIFGGALLYFGGTYFAYTLDKWRKKHKSAFNK